jgi:chemosensory pili system protein ChpA (sensor histidine kinase/response regulator)
MADRHSHTDLETGPEYLGSLAWVLGETRKSIEAAIEALRCYARQAQAAIEVNIRSVDVNLLRMAGQQLHQAEGALGMVGLNVAARMVGGMESLMQQFVAKPQKINPQTVAIQERAGIALIEYLESQLSSRPRSALGLFAQYCQVQELAGADRIHPADLWDWPWQWAMPQLPRTAPKLGYSVQARQCLDQGMLRIMRGDDVSAAADLYAVSLGLALGEEERHRAHAAAFWLLVAGFFEALGNKRVPLDLYAKRVIARILPQYATLAGGDDLISAQLARDLLFFCAQAEARDAIITTLPALTAVRAAWGLDKYTPVDYRQPMFGLYAPAVLRQAQRRVEAIKESWSALTGGDMSRLRMCSGQIDRVTESLAKLLPKAQPLADELKTVMAQVAHANRPPSSELAMETATVVLFLEASLTDFHPADNLLETRARQLAQRLKTAREGAMAPALQPWMEQLYRQVSDRQSMDTVVSELRVTLGEVEQCLDQFFRDRADQAPLARVPDLLRQMRGVLSMLGLDQAARAVTRMREQVEGLMASDSASAAQVARVFDALGNSLGSLGFLVDMLGYQPALAYKLFVYDAASGALEAPHMGRASAKYIAAADATRNEQCASSADSATTLRPLTGKEPALVTSAAATALALTAHRLVQHERIDQITASAALDEKPPLTVTHQTAVAAQQQNTDDGLLGIFLDEARQVIAGGQAAIEALAMTPTDMEQKAILRRTFHTLKGSSHMVGLTEFGEAAWALEQVLNTWLAEQKPMAEYLRNLSVQALNAMSRWVSDIAAQNTAHWSSAPFRQAADALRLHGQYQPLDLSGGTDAAQAEQLLAALPASTVSRTGPRGAAAISSQGNSEVSATTVLPDTGIAQPKALRSPDAPKMPAATFVPAFDIDQFPDLSFASTEPMPLVPDQAPATQSSAALGTDHLFDADSNVSQGAVKAEAIKVVPAPVPGEAEFAETAPIPAGEAQEIDFPVFDQALQALQAESGKTRSISEFAGDQEPMRKLMPPEVDQVVKPSAVPPEAAPAAVAQRIESAQPPVELVRRLTDVDDAATPEESVPAQTAQQLTPPSSSRPDVQIGDLRIGAELYDAYLKEAQHWSRELSHELTEWERALDNPVPESAIARVHSLADSSTTIGLTALSNLARAVERALMRLRQQDGGLPGQWRALDDAATEISHMLRQFAAGSLQQPSRAVLDAVNAIGAVAQAASSTQVSSVPFITSMKIQTAAQHATTVRTQAGQAPIAARVAPIPVLAQATVPVTITVKDASRRAAADNIGVADAVDPDLFPVFEEEAKELLPQLQGGLREWIANPGNDLAREQVKRVLHTLKGSARLAGALRLGEMTHHAESAIEVIDTGHVTSADLEPIQGHVDAITEAFACLQTDQRQDRQTGSTVPLADAAAASTMAAPAPAARASQPVLAIAGQPVAPGQPTPVRSDQIAPPAPLLPQQVHNAASQVVRVKTQLLDHLVNQASEIMTSRSRLAAGVGQLRSALADLSGNLGRLRTQLRDVELQAETQMQSRMARTKDEQQQFDPLEFDRFTRMQELTRMMAESVNDVATVQYALQRAVASGEDNLMVQARQARELQQGLLRTRMVEFDSIAERLHLVVRQAAKEEGKQVRLDIVGGAIEVDRGILERITACFEHLLRNSVVHGIEAAPLRAERHKDATGVITIEVHQAGNDVSIEFSDDGSGLDLQRIRQQAEQRGLIQPGQTLSDGEIANLVFVSGLSTASQVTGLAGRGVGMDVVRTEARALGGRIQTSTRAGRETRFKLVLPLTTAVTQVVMLRMGEITIGVPSSLVEIVRRVNSADLQQAYDSGVFTYGESALPLFWGGALLQNSPGSQQPPARAAPVIVFHSAGQRLAMHVDEVLGNQEVVIKALGPQLSRLPGLVAVTTLALGEVAPIYNPVALAGAYGDQARALTASMRQPAALDAPPVTASQAPLVLVVDDSITVRRVAQRLLQREGYRVALAADGLQGLERLHQERPAVVLSDIEMPRMDGFDLVRNIRADQQLCDLPVIMITSRMAEKHREHARELGVDHYLGKPYSEEQLLMLVRDCARPAVPAG